MKNKNNQEVNIFSLKDIIKPIVWAVLISMIVLTFVRITIVNGHSMDATLSDGQQLIVSRVAYDFNAKPQRNDIVVAKPQNINVEYIIKRVIAIPGDTVEIKDNTIYVNDVALVENYIKEPMITADIAKFTLAEGEYFLCGDNRNNSLDSRSELIGNINIDDIYGKIVFDVSNFKLMK